MVERIYHKVESNIIMAVKRECTRIKAREKHNGLSDTRDNITRRGNRPIAPKPVCQFSSEIFTPPFH